MSGALTRIDAPDADQVVVVFGAVAFADWLNWIAGLKSQHVREVRLNGEGMTVHAYLRTIEGPLRLDGKGSWTHGDSPAFLAIARVPPQHQQQLAPLLRLIAVERGAGSFELSSTKTAFGP